MNEYRSYKLACTKQPCERTQQETVHSYLQKARLSAREKRRNLNKAHIHAKVELENLVIIYCIYNSIKIIKLIIVKNHAYLLLTTFADPS